MRVEPASLFVQLNDASKAPGTVDPALSYQLSSGTLYGADRLTGTPVRGAGEAIGNYAISEGNITAGSNYRVQARPGVFAITAVPAAPGSPALAANVGGSVVAGLAGSAGLSGLSGLSGLTGLLSLPNLAGLINDDDLKAKGLRQRGSKLFEIEGSGVNEGL